MTLLGMPTEMFLVFLATLLAGSLGAIHYVVVHVIMDKPFADSTQRADAGPSFDSDAGER